MGCGGRKQKLIVLKSMLELGTEVDKYLGEYYGNENDSFIKNRLYKNKSIKDINALHQYESNYNICLLN